jgi:hypothetical protein
MARSMPAVLLTAFAIASAAAQAVCTESSDSHVLVMQSAEEWL